jgi:DNA-binding NarL/FixJ family response regulator
MEPKEFSPTAAAVLDFARKGSTSRWIANKLKLNRTTVRRHILALRARRTLGERAA